MNVGDERVVATASKLNQFGERTWKACLTQTAKTRRAKKEAGR
jgi:hypothetical protein